MNIFHKIVSTVGLGVLGVDPITAVYILTMGLRKVKKVQITLFFLSFAVFSIVIGSIVSVVFGVAAVDFLKSIMPGDDSPFWAWLNFIVSILIFIWVFKKFLIKPKVKSEKETKAIDGSSLKYITTGFVFALTCFTDPTYYAVMLIGGETENFVLSVFLLTIWFIVSQFMALIVYISNQLNLLNKLTIFIDKLKQKNLKCFKYIFYILLLIVAIALLIDAGYFLFTGKYLF